MLESFDITVLSRYTTKQKNQRFSKMYHIMLQLFHESLRSSLDNSAFGDLVKYFLDISSLLLLEITSLVQS